MNDCLHAELWTSWASMLRVYAAAHGLGSMYHAVVEVGSEEIVLRVNDRWIRFTRESAEDSEGSVTGFALMEDGSVKLGEVAEEIDMAAEQVARRMMSTQ